MGVAAGLIVACVAVYVVAPFTATHTERIGFAAPEPPAPGAPFGSSDLTAERVEAGVSHCGSAVVDAWQTRKGPGTWFGYAPITAAIVTFPGSCRADARHRLWMAAAAILVAFGLLLAARAVDRRPETGSGPVSYTHLTLPTNREV